MGKRGLALLLCVVLYFGFTGEIPRIYAAPETGNEAAGADTSIGGVEPAAVDSADESTAAPEISQEETILAAAEEEADPDSPEPVAPATETPNTETPNMETPGTETPNTETQEVPTHRHCYKDGVCTVCGAPVAFDIQFLTPEDPGYAEDHQENIHIYTTDKDGNRVPLTHAQMREIATIIVMLKSDQPDYRYEMALNADLHNSPNTFYANDIYVQSMAQFNNAWETLYFTLYVDEEDHQMKVCDISGGNVKITIPEFDEETGYYKDCGPDGQPWYALELDLVRREPGEAPPAAATVDSGFRMNLYDYTVNSNESEGLLSPASAEGINAVSDLQFYNGEGGQEAAKESNTITDSAIARQGIVEETMGADGYPALTEFAGDSLDVLFDENEIAGAKEVYRNVDGLFMDDGNGGLVYNSTLNYAYYDKSQGDGGRFTVYDGTYNQGRLTDYSMIDSGVSIGYFPFDEYNDLMTVLTADTDEPLNHGHGMFLEGTAIIPDGGKVDGEALSFSFAGDDDTWLFIDDVLVLDGGGIHSRISGSVDFSTGKVTVSNAISIGAAGKTTGTNTTLEKIFADAGRTYTQEGEHTFRFYSLERDGNASDLKIETNLNKVLGVARKDVTVEKKWVDENGEETEPWIDSVVVQLYQTVNGEKTAVEGKRLLLSEKNDWKGSFKSLPGTTEVNGSTALIDYSVEEENTPDGTVVSYERGGEEVGSDIYWVKARFENGMEPGIYAIMGDEYENGEAVSHQVMTAQGEDKEISYEDGYLYTPEETIVDYRDGEMYDEYLAPVKDPQIWTIAKTEPVKSVMRAVSQYEYETETGPDGTVYKVLVPYVSAYSFAQIPSQWRYGEMFFYPNSNTEFYVVDDGDSSQTAYSSYSHPFYIKDEDGNFVKLEGDVGALTIDTKIYDGDYVKCVDPSNGEILYVKDGDDYRVYRKKEDGTFEQVDYYYNRYRLTRLSNCEKNKDGYVVWHLIMPVANQPTELYSDETFYEFYKKTDNGYERTDSVNTDTGMHMYMPTVIPKRDENGYIILTRGSGSYKEYYYAKDDGTVWKKDDAGNYTRVYPLAGNGYVKKKVTETEGPEYEWVISNQGLNLTLVGPGQQWFDYTFITSKKDAQGNSNDTVIGTESMVMGAGYLQSFYSDYNYRNVFRFEDMDSTYGNMPSGTGDYEQFGARIFSFQDIWVFNGVVTPYEKNVTINTSSYTTKESYDLSQAGRFWFYKPVPVEKTYDLSKNDWTLTNHPAGDLKITKRTSDGSGKDEIFTFTVTLKGEGAEKVTGTYGDLEFTGGMAVAELKAGESALAKNLPAGLSYTVAETLPNYYIQVSKSGEEGTIETAKTANAVFVNRKPVGSLTVEKRTEGGAPLHDQFTFKVVLGDTAVNGTYGDMTFRGGVAELKLRSGQIAKASGLPAGISYTVTETVPAGYELTVKTNPEGTIPDGDTAKALFINTYSRDVTPVPPEQPVPEEVPDEPEPTATPTPTPTAIATPTPTPTPTPQQEQPWNWNETPETPVQPQTTVPQTVVPATPATTTTTTTVTTTTVTGGETIEDEEVPLAFPAGQRPGTQDPDRHEGRLWILLLFAAAALIGMRIYTGYRDRQSGLEK